VYNQENAYRRAAIERLLGWREKNSRESRFYFGHLSRKMLVVSVNTHRKIISKSFYQIFLLHDGVTNLVVFGAPNWFPTNFLIFHILFLTTSSRTKWLSSVLKIIKCNLSTTPFL
jgi:hypothetical protein